MVKKTVVVSLLGTQLDSVGRGKKRWQRWRPNISLVSQDSLMIDELHLIYPDASWHLANNVAVDIETISAQTKVTLHCIDFADPWDFGEVYAKLYDFCSVLEFDIDRNDYLFHITTGTHVAQICCFLLTESHHFPGRLIQTSPDSSQEDKAKGRTQIIDLDLSKYDQLATRFDAEHEHGTDFLKGGIATRSAAFNTMIAQIEKVAIRSDAPILLTGPTGAGKSQLAGRIYQLKKKRAALTGELITVNCATLKGENAMAALFGHTKGAFTGAATARGGFLKAADNGLLFLDEVGELGLEEQAMLLRAIENKSFHPVGSDKEIQSNFQLIAGTNRDLKLAVNKGEFREDLLARINLWSYELPGLKDRKEDIEANIEFELQKFSQKHGNKIRFNKEARTAYLNFAYSANATWRGNFRDLGSSITRLCTLADSSRIALSDVHEETQRLSADWQPNTTKSVSLAVQLLSDETLASLDSFDRHQLEYVLSVCANQSSLASAGRALFDVSRTRKASHNDSSRLQKYLAKFGIRWEQVQRLAN
ncbi:RNA repair transcriptional activator RtcR [Celerinatantimonas sp. MCCC 1A17872]|uniref:RNA repair transcriptional activator RtcR n=1 Tax=Celerinatantimonas sp. MCCC 1A17872 TaxID=3177514 RepID=UPI0038CA5148